MNPPAFEYVAASSAADAVEALRRHGDEAKILAGGQSLIPMLALRLARPSALVDINRCDDLEGLAESGGVLTVGALARQRDLERWARTGSPLLSEALGWVAHAPIRNRGTVVGNLVHADPASELPALLLCLDGSVLARRKGGERVIPADKLYLAPLTTSLDSDEMATAARVTIAEVEQIVEVGELDPEAVVTPGIFVRHILQGASYERRIERRTVRSASAGA